MSLAAVSKHLIVLEKAGLVKRRRNGRVHSLALEAKPMQEAQAWIDRYRKFWEGNLDQFEKYLDKLQTKGTKHDDQANEVQKPDDATLILRRMLNATPELAFEAWTSPEHIQQWMRPEPGMVVPLASMDLRVGGKFRIQMKNAGRGVFHRGGEFQEVKAPERLVYTWDWEKDGSGAEFGEVEGKDVPDHGGISSNEANRRNSCSRILASPRWKAGIITRGDGAESRTVLQLFGEGITRIFCEPKSRDSSCKMLTIGLNRRAVGLAYKKRKL